MFGSIVLNWSGKTDPWGKSASSPKPDLYALPVVGSVDICSISLNIGFNLPSSISKSFISFNNLLLVSLSTLLPAFLKFFKMFPVIASIFNIAFSALLVSFASAPSILILSSKPSWVSFPLALKGREIYLSIHLSNESVIALPVPVWFFNLPATLPAAPIAPVNAAPSKPNFNLFKSSASGVLDSLSNFVGPPNKSPKLPASSTSPTNTASATPPATAPLPNLLNFSAFDK